MPEIDVEAFAAAAERAMRQAKDAPPGLRRPATLSEAGQLAIQVGREVLVQAQRALAERDARIEALERRLGALERRP